MKKILDYINKNEENLSNVYNFNSDFNLDLKSYVFSCHGGMYVSLAFS